MPRITQILFSESYTHTSWKALDLLIPNINLWISNTISIFRVQIWIANLVIEHHIFAKEPSISAKGPLHIDIDTFGCILVDICKIRVFHLWDVTYVCVYLYEALLGRHRALIRNSKISITLNTRATQFYFFVYLHVCTFLLCWLRYMCWVCFVRMWVSRVLRVLRVCVCVTGVGCVVLCLGLFTCIYVQGCFAYMNGSFVNICRAVLWKHMVYDKSPKYQLRGV